MTSMNITRSSCTFRKCSNIWNIFRNSFPSDLTIKCAVNRSAKPKVPFTGAIPVIVVVKYVVVVVVVSINQIRLISCHVAVACGPAAEQAVFSAFDHEKSSSHWRGAFGVESPWPTFFLVCGIFLY